MPIDGRNAVTPVGKGGVGLVRADTGVAAAHDARAGTVEPGVIVQDRGEPLAHRRVDEGGTGHDRRGHRDHATASGEQFEDLGVGVDAVGAEEGAVLNRVRTDGERVRHRLAAVRVYGQGQPGGVRLLQRDGELGSSELRLVRSDGRGHVAATGHHLDYVHAAGHALTHRLTHAVDALGLAT
jgi:hypothetical protein